MSRAWWVAGAAGAAALILAAGLVRHPASAGPAVAFHAAFAALALLVVPRPRSHLYSALAAMLVLGFWTKFLLRLLSDQEYLEPIGSFDGSTEAWDRALLTVVAGVLGVVTCRLVHLGWTRFRLDGGGDRPTNPAVAPWFRAWRPWLWSATLVVAVGLYVWNAWAAVFITGLPPRVILPWSLNAVLAWWYVLGLPLWLATLIGWELEARPSATVGPRLLLVPMAEAIVNAGSLLSRASFVLRVTPYLIAGTREQSGRRVRLGVSRGLLVSMLAIGFVASLVPVTVLRVQVYPPSADLLAEGGQASPVLEATLEVGRLFLDRWTGMEGVLAVTSEPTRSPALLAEALGEDPNLGERAMYQRIAQSRYPARDDFTFLTLAGAIAILALSGSAVVVWIGMALVAALCMACESFCRRATGNELVCAVLGVGAAFAVAQVTFPKLLGVFLIELWATVLCLASLHWLVARTGARPSG